MSRTKGREPFTFATTPPWTVEDDARLLVCWGLMPVPRIARRLKRTSTAVHNRYRRLYRLWVDTFEPEALSTRGEKS